MKRHMNSRDSEMSPTDTGLCVTELVPMALAWPGKEAGHVQKYPLNQCPSQLLPAHDRTSRHKDGPSPHPPQNDVLGTLPVRGRSTNPKLLACPRASSEVETHRRVLLT